MKKLEAYVKPDNPRRHIKQVSKVGKLIAVFALATIISIAFTKLYYKMNHLMWIEWWYLDDKEEAIRNRYGAALGKWCFSLIPKLLPNDFVLEISKMKFEHKKGSSSFYSIVMIYILGNSNSIDGPLSLICLMDEYAEEFSTYIRRGNEEECLGSLCADWNRYDLSPNYWHDRY